MHGKGPSAETVPPLLQDAQPGIKSKNVPSDVFFFFASPEACGSCLVMDQTRTTVEARATAVTTPDPQPAELRENSFPSDFKRHFYPKRNWNNSFEKTSKGAEKRAPASETHQAVLNVFIFCSTGVRSTRTEEEEVPEAELCYQNWLVSFSCRELS